VTATLRGQHSRYWPSITERVFAKTCWGALEEFIAEEGPDTADVPLHPKGCPRSPGLPGAAPARGVAGRSDLEAFVDAERRHAAETTAWSDLATAGSAPAGRGGRPPHGGGHATPSPSRGPACSSRVTAAFARAGGPEIAEPGDRIYLYQVLGQLNCLNSEVHTDRMIGLLGDKPLAVVLALGDVTWMDPSSLEGLKRLTLACSLVGVPFHLAVLQPSTGEALRGEVWFRDLEADGRVWPSEQAALAAATPSDGDDSAGSSDAMGSGLVRRHAHPTGDASEAMGSGY